MALSRIARVTDTLRQNQVLRNVRRNSASLLNTQEQASSGLKLTRVSDDPTGTVRVQRMAAQREQVGRYADNASQGLSRMNATDAAMQDLTDLLNDTRALLLQESQDTSSDSTRRLAGQHVARILEAALDVANRKIGNEYLFAGAQTSDAPFKLVGGAVQYVGDNGALDTRIGEGLLVKTNMTGLDAFGALTARQRGVVDLNPILTRETLLADLNTDAQGVRAGVIAGKVQFADGNQTAVVDFTGANTVGDALDRINSLGFVTAAIDKDKLKLVASAAAAGAFKVQEVLGGHTAQSLGILQTAVGTTITGADLKPALTLKTSIEALFNGDTSIFTAADKAAGIVLTNTAGQFTQTGTARFTDATTVEDLINALEQTGVSVQVEINAKKTGLDIINQLNGARLNVTNGAGGTAADDFGWTTRFASNIPLDTINNGLGLDTVEADDFTIEVRDGRAFSVDVSKARTVKDIVDLINKDPDNVALGGPVTAALNAAGDGIKLTDNTAGAGAFRVTQINGSYAARTLGVEKTAAAATPGTIDGDALNFVGLETESIFTDLARLRDALQSNDVAQLRMLTRRFDQDMNLMLEGRADLGGRMKRAELAQNQLTGQGEQLDILLTEERGADMAETLLAMQNQTNTLQASLGVSAQLFNLSLLDFLG